MARVTAPEPTRPYVLVEADGAAGLLDISDAEVVALFKQHGALLFRGYPADLDLFRKFAERFCPTAVVNESPNRQLLDETSGIQSVDGGSEAFPLHPELSREPWKPDVCFFHCLVPPAVGGETTICDGVEIVRQLPPEIRRSFEGRRLVYPQPVAPWLLKFWFGTETPTEAQLLYPPPDCPYQFFVTEGQLYRAFSRYALHKPMFTDAPAFGNFLLFARYLHGRDDYPILDDGYPVPREWTEAVKAVSDRLTIPIEWRTGDLLMIDNSRFMHGRNAILDTTARRIASYFGYLSFAPPDPEEPANPIWRRENFVPPMPPAA